MTREDAESRIRDLLIEVLKVVRDYETNSGYLQASIYVEPPFGRGSYVHFWNESWGGGCDKRAGRSLDYEEFGIDLGEQK